MFKKITTAVLSFLIFGFLVRTSYAEQVVIEVSGNGGGSDNSVQFTSNNSSTVDQSNNAEIQNNVSSDANTGNNQAGSNTGDVVTNTGDANSSSTINNNNINSNNYDGACDCPSGNVSAVISGNGAYSDNVLNLGINNNTDVSQSNSAYITNNVLNHANSGYNNADNNNGDVIIITGKAGAYTKISNKNININVDPSGNSSNLISLIINGNGAGSINLASLIFNNSLKYTSSNIAVLFNNVVNEANTGHNSANNNNGTVLIATGDAVSIVEIANEDINGSTVELCACTIAPLPPPPGNGGENPPPSSNPPSSGGNGGSSISQGAGSVLGAAIGNVLPATGGYLLLLMTILCLTILLAGGYLRFGSGISPPTSYAI